MPRPPRAKNQEIAETFVKDERYRRNLLYVEDWNMFYLYADGWYHSVPTQEFIRLMLSFIKEQFPDLNITMALTNDIVSQVKGTCRSVKEIESPYIAFNDCLYNLETFSFEAFDDTKIAIHHIDIPAEKLNTTTPQFENFLRTTLVDEKGKTDEQLIILVQEMLGFYLLNNLKAQAVFFLVGRGANGKSVLINVVEKMIGAEYVSAMSIQSLTMNNFATSGLIGKKVNLCNEEESKYLRSDRFKALISGDLIMGERKHENHFYFHPKTKYLFATNAMPTFDGINHGIRRRMQIIQFNRVFEPHEQDRDLSEKLGTEIGGIVGWALKGAQRLVSNGYRFSQSDNVDEAILSFENQTSSALAYFRENYEVSDDPNDFMSADDMYELYRQWCEKYGKKPMSEPVFGRDIGDNIFKGARSTIKWSNGQARRGRQIRVKHLQAEESADDLLSRITEEFGHG